VGWFRLGLGTTEVAFTGTIVGIATAEGDSPAGKPNVWDFAIVKEVDATSPSLFAAIKGQSNLPTVLIEEYGETNGPYHVLNTIKLTNATVKVRPVPPKKGKACEEVSIAFEEIHSNGLRMTRLSPWVTSLR
jgi:type VI protein secretion system component Hcp